MSRHFLLTLQDPISAELREKVDRLSAGLGPIEICQGIDGRKWPATDYYALMAKAYTEHRQIITPAEMGATLSHMMMLQKFSQSSEEVAVLFEDDVILKPNSIDMLTAVLSFVGAPDILVACDQRGLEYLGEVRGRRLQGEYVCYEVQKEDWRTVKRSCAYVVGREAAAHIIEVHGRGIWPPDDFRVLCPSHGRLLLCDAFAHPLTNDGSALESERLLKPASLPPRSLSSRLREEISKTIAPRRERLCRQLRSRVGGYRVIGG